MQTVTTLAELRAARRSLPGTVGFVPTMGYLHAGHISLARRARAECASVVASIFVNPTQFGPNEDLAKYPRDLPRDLAQLEAAGVNAGLDAHAGGNVPARLPDLGYCGSPDASAGGGSPANAFQGRDDHRSQAVQRGRAG